MNVANTGSSQGSPFPRNQSGPFSCSVLLGVDLAYDSVGRRAEVDLRPAGATSGNRMLYTCDAASRLTRIEYDQASGSGWTTLGDLTYAYDAVGNRISVGGAWARTVVPPALGSATYDAANQLATFDSTAFTYDVAGELVNDGVPQYFWNSRHHLTSLTGEGVSFHYLYDPFGRRVARQTSTGSVDYLYDGENPVADFIPGGTFRFFVTGLGLDEYFLRQDESGLSTILSDALQSTIALGNASGAVQTTFTYEPFGWPTE